MKKKSHNFLIKQGPSSVFEKTTQEKNNRKSLKEQYFVKHVIQY